MVKLELKPSEYILRNFTLTKAYSPRTSPQPARQPQHGLSLQSERRGRGGEISPDQARPMWQNSEFPTPAPMYKTACRTNGMETYPTPISGALAGKQP
jgi:hypothetical protein